ncbi:hypothetical protein [Photobacterium sp.]|uniref:hypothetical protein n=1 Tax=Photobacterium sp. TaxID=660 RepID=UPI00299F2969|nr:hypothetical protein [Photobacterium sp.]MDX1302250.1 hypothetical protein [Photobacterium sp.]
MKLKKALTIPTWTLVGTGLLLNVVSALMTNFYIDDATRQANAFIQKQADNDKLITLIWQQVETVERKREHVLDLMVNSDSMNKPLAPEIMQQVISDLNYWIKNDISILSLDGVSSLMVELNEVQLELRDKINHLYLENLDLSDLYSDEMKYISRLRNLALFLQVIGLGLVLSRDLSRRDDMDKKSKPHKIGYGAWD